MSPRHTRGRPVDAQVADRHRRRRSARRPAQQGADAGDEHRERERLRQVVVGARVERLGLVELAVLGREHEDRRPDAGGAQVGAHLEPVAPGQHDVEDHEVVAALDRHPPPFQPVVGDLDREALGLEAAPHGAGDLPVVLDQQHLHARPPGDSLAGFAEPPLNERLAVQRSVRPAVRRSARQPTGATHEPSSDHRPHRHAWPRVRRGRRRLDTTEPAPVIDPGDGGDYAPDIDPASFVDVIDNPYLPYAVGSRWVYEGESDGEVERIEVVVLDDTREVMGITATVVRDTVYVDDEMVEDTYDWFAQDADGNVWYLGEDTREFEDGVAVNAAGAWEAGIDGALPGIVMPADPQVGDAFRQEFYPGEAEDMGEIIEVGVARSIGLGDFDDVVVMTHWTPLEPDVVEEKWYAEASGRSTRKRSAVATSSSSSSSSRHRRPDAVS